MGSPSRREGEEAASGESKERAALVLAGKKRGPKSPEEARAGIRWVELRIGSRYSVVEVKYRETAILVGE